MEARRRAPLTKDRVLSTAIRLADEGGIASLSMRKLGHALGVEAMSLYNHVASKDDVLDGIADHVLQEIDLPSDGDDWEQALWTCAVSAHTALASHPWACHLIMSIPRPLPARLRYMDSILRCLREAGFSAAATYHGYHALDSHILGFTLWEAGHAISAEDLAELAAFVPRLTAAGFPYLSEHAEQHISDMNRRDTQHEDDGEFEFGLRLILDGLERLRASGS